MERAPLYRRAQRPSWRMTVATRTSRASSSQSSSIHIGGVGVVQWQASRWHAVWPVPAATFTSTLPPLSVTVLELTLT
ncbi:hypothetical protein RKD27_001067 [Streptomyces sp. SAI-126]|nr:hypothetical protein [Streptomyces sp. SAI-119]MDH6494547.1 hypothetical protein [Streptomyces sp. SAI-149]